MFQHGSSEVPAKVQERSRKFPAQITQCSRKVPATFQHRFQEGSRKVPARFQQSSDDDPASLQQVQARFQQHSSKVPARSQGRFQARFQEGSSKVPGLFRFSGRAFSWHQSPAPEITTQQIRCWELIHTSIVMVLALFLLQAFTIFGKDKNHIYITDLLLVPPLGTLPEATYWGPGAKIQFSMQTSR